MVDIKHEDCIKPDKSRDKTDVSASKLSAAVADEAMVHLDVFSPEIGRPVLILYAT